MKHTDLWHRLAELLTDENKLQWPILRYCFIFLEGLRKKCVRVSSL